MVPVDCSVVVALNPHHNDLALVLDSYVRQAGTAMSFEVIVVDGGGRDEADRTYRHHRRRFSRTPVRLLRIDGIGRAAANNAGARASRSRLLLFVGDDFIPAPTLVRAHVEFHRNVLRGAVAGIGPSFFPDALRGDPFRCWLEDSGLLFGVPFRLAAAHWPRDFFYAGNVSINRATFDRLGAFDDALHDTGDDFDFGLRLREDGGCSHFLPKAVAWHDHALTLSERADAVRYSGARARRIIARHGEIAEWVKFIALPLAHFATDVADAEERHRAAPDATTRIGCYQSLMDLAFAEGFNGVGADVEQMTASVRGQ
jgi:GT2 family glycosyltransferase